MSTCHHAKLLDWGRISPAVCSPALDVQYPCARSRLPPGSPGPPFRYDSSPLKACRVFPLYPLSVLRPAPISLLKSLAFLCARRVFPILSQPVIYRHRVMTSLPNLFCPETVKPVPVPRPFPPRIPRMPFVLAAPSMVSTPGFFDHPLFILSSSPTSALPSFQAEVPALYALQAPTPFSLVALEPDRPGPRRSPRLTESTFTQVRPLSEPGARRTPARCQLSPYACHSVFLE